MAKIDALDRKILALLDGDARMSMSDIARKVRHGRDIVDYRVQRMMREEMITGFRALIDPSALGFGMFKTYFKLQKRSGEIERFRKALSKSPHVSCYAEAIGHWDLIANVLAENAHQFAAVLDDLCAPMQESIVDTEFAAVRRYRALGRSHFSATVWRTRPEFVSCAQRSATEIDQLDSKIILLLGANARISITDLADNLAVHPMTVGRRIERLEREKVIIGYRASIKQAAVQKEVYKILVERNTFSRPKIEALITAVGRESAVVACIEHLGPYHLELNMETSSLEECEETLARLLVNHREVLSRQTIIRMKREGFNPFRALSMSSNRKIGRDAVLERAFAANEI